MNSMDLKTRLAQETQVRNQSIELAASELKNIAASFQQQLSESAEKLRSDMRDDAKKARESWAEFAKAERQCWEGSRRRTTAELEQIKRRLLVWGPMVLLATVLITVGLTVWATVFSVKMATGFAYTELQQIEATRVAESRSQVETARLALQSINAQVDAKKAELGQITGKIEAEQLRLKDAQQRQTRLTTYDGTKPGTIFVRVRPGVRTFIHEGQTLIQAETTQ